VEDGVGGAIGIVFEVVRLGAGELIAGMEARDLDHPFEIQIRDGLLGLAEEVVIFQEIVEHVGMDDQSGVHLLGLGLVQKTQLVHQIEKEIGRGLRRADHEADLVAQVHGPGERAEVEADHGLFEPLAGLADDLLGGLAGGPCIIHGPPRIPYPQSRGRRDRNSRRPPPYNTLGAIPSPLRP
jgi:hypothetical protein